MQSREKQDLQLLNQMIKALNDYLTAKGTDKKIALNRKGRRDNVKAIAHYIFACAGMSSPLDEVETSVDILPFLQSHPQLNPLLADSVSGPWVYFRMIMGIRSVFDRLQTSIGFSSLRKKIMPFIEKWEALLLEREVDYQGMVIAADPFLTNAEPRYRVNTSSHTYQSIKIKFSNKNEKEIFEIAASTWNLMDKDKNPWGHVETSQEYLLRKERQFAKLIEIITSGKKDFIFLQEVDCLTIPTFLVEFEAIKTLSVLQKNFFNYLKRLGWDAISNESLLPDQIFITLYNANTVTPTSKNRMILDGAGFENEFTHYASGEKIVLVNLHLDPTKDYRSKMADFQQAQVRTNRTTIMGGALERPKARLPGLINRTMSCTSLTTKKEVVCLRHCSDGFLLNTNQKLQATIKEQPAEVFFRDQETRQVLVQPLVPAEEYETSCQHLCPPGAAWREKAWERFIEKGGWPAYLEYLELKAEKNWGFFVQRPAVIEEELEEKLREDDSFQHSK